MNYGQYGPSSKSHNIKEIASIEQVHNIKEIASIEQAQNTKPCVDAESLKIKSDVCEISRLGNSERKELHLRPDVVNKTLLRAVKRFYFKKFKALHQSMVNKRFANIKTRAILDTLAEF